MPNLSDIRNWLKVALSFAVYSDDSRIYKHAIRTALIDAGAVAVEPMGRPHLGDIEFRITGKTATITATFDVADGSYRVLAIGSGEGVEPPF